MNDDLDKESAEIALLNELREQLSKKVARLPHFPKLDRGQTIAENMDRRENGKTFNPSMHAKVFREICSPPYKVSHQLPTDNAAMLMARTKRSLMDALAECEGHLRKTDSDDFDDNGNLKKIIALFKEARDECQIYADKIDPPPPHTSLELALRTRLDHYFHEKLPAKLDDEDVVPLEVREAILDIADPERIVKEMGLGKRSLGDGLLALRNESRMIKQIIRDANLPNEAEVLNLYAPQLNALNDCIKLCEVSKNMGIEFPAATKPKLSRD